MYIAFIGSEAMEIHGLKKALQNTYTLEECNLDGINDVLKYQKDHGMKPVLMANSFRDIKLYYNSIVNNL